MFLIHKEVFSLTYNHLFFLNVATWAILDNINIFYFVISTIPSMSTYFMLDSIMCKFSKSEPFLLLLAHPWGYWCISRTIEKNDVSNGTFTLGWETLAEWPLPMKSQCKCTHMHVSGFCVQNSHVDNLKTRTLSGSTCKTCGNWEYIISWNQLDFDQPQSRIWCTFQNMEVPTVWQSDNEGQMNHCGFFCLG